MRASIAETVEVERVVYEVLGRSQVLQTLTLVRSLGVQRLRLLFGLVVKPRRGVGEVCGWEGKSKGRNRERKGL